MMGIILKLSSCFLAVIFLLCWTDSVEGINIASQYFLTINIPNNAKRSYLENIKKILCDPKRNSVKCFLNFKVVGEPKAILVLNVENSFELERRIAVLSSRTSFKFESEPLVNYADFARNVLGVNNETAILKGNTLKQTREVIWCEFNINFGDKNSTELLEIWRREAEVVFSVRNSGGDIEIFKTLGERSVHLFTDSPASEFDRTLFNVPFAQEIPNSLKTTCKVAIKF